MSELPPSFSPLKRRIIFIIGGLMVAGSVAALIWWLSGDLTTMSPGWPIGAFAGIPLGVLLLIAAVHGRQLAMFPGNPQAEWRRVSFIWSFRGFIAVIVLCVVIPLRWMFEPRLPTPWWLWLIWAVAMVALPFAFSRARKLRQECRDDDRQTGR
jgi:hypothetical protein